LNEIEPQWYSLLPPVLAITVAIASRQVLLALLGGIWLAACLLFWVNPLAGLAAGLNAIIEVFASAGDTRVLLFTLLVGAMVGTMEKAGAVRGFVAWLENRRWVNSGTRAQWLAWGTGVVVFVESNLTLLVAGTTARPLFDRYKIAREKLAYIIDSTSAPICMLFPFNAWGAFVLGLLAATGVDNPLWVLIIAVPLNIYALTAVALAAFSIAFDKDFGPMRAAQERTRNGALVWPNAQPMIDPSLFGNDEDRTGSAKLMLLPIICLVAFLPVGLWITGEGNILAGSGSLSVLWSVCLAIALLWGLCLATKALPLAELIGSFYRGCGAMVPVAMILLLAIALGDLTKALKAGEFVAAAISDTLPIWLLPPLIFIVSAAMAFAVGSSWGTLAILVPIAVPVSAALGIAPAPFLAAVLSGAIFGDHCSPISDTTVVASMAAATDHIDHVRTQLPYALGAGAFSTVAFSVIGLLLL
jgi:Na+/H+ antiporter NhaC